MVRNGQVSAPIVIGRDHLDSGSFASLIARPSRWPWQRRHRRLAVLNALVTRQVGPRGQHPPRWRRRYRPVDPRRNVVVADGTDLAAEKLARVLVATPAWAGFATPTPAPRASDVAAERGVRIPMTESADEGYCSRHRHGRHPCCAGGRERVTVEEFGDTGYAAVHRRSHRHDRHANGAGWPPTRSACRCGSRRSKWATTLATPTSRVFRSPRG